MNREHNFICVKHPGHNKLWYREVKGHHSRKPCWVPLDESFFRKKIPYFSQLHEAARSKQVKRLIEEGNIISKVKLPSDLPPAKKWVQRPEGYRERYNNTDLQTGALVSLRVLDLFGSVETGAILLANLLGGLRATALQKQEPDFRAAVALDTPSSEAEKLLIDLLRTTSNKTRWRSRHYTARRKLVLNYAKASYGFSRHIQDFSTVCFPIKEHTKLKVPMSYRNAVATVVQAGRNNLLEAEPYLCQGCAVLINCSSVEWCRSKLRPAALNHYDSLVYQFIQEHRAQLSLMLAYWWCSVDGNWAPSIIKQARASFGKPDSRFVSMTPDPKLYHRAILHQILLSYLAFLQNQQMLPSEMLEPYAAMVRGVFVPEIPAEPEAAPPRSLEDPEVFLEVMKELSSSNPDRIASLDQSFSRQHKHLGAWRDISGERHLIMLEDTWAKELAKAARNTEGVDCSILRHDNWTGEMQRLMANAGVIKKPSAGYRYRYDLLGDGTRDRTYVVAIPQRLL